jgi:small subunit ribosomal protein S3Ae
MMVKKITAKDKWKSKAWYNIVAPKEFGEIVVGETPSAAPEAVVGRTVWVNAAEVATGPRMNQVRLLFKVENVSGNTARTKTAGYEMTRSFVRSMVRRNRNKIEIVKDYKTADGAAIRVKSVTMTAGNCYAGQEKDLRKAIGESFDEVLAGKTLAEVVTGVVDHSMQDAVRAKCKKIFPISALEVRKVEFVEPVQAKK